MIHVDIARPDYLANHQAAVLAGDVPADTPAPTVHRHENITLRCSHRDCPDPCFTASFDEVQRIVACPNCNREVFIPEEYRGTP